MKKPHWEITERHHEMPANAGCGFRAEVEFTAIPRSVEKKQHLLEV